MLSWTQWAAVTTCLQSDNQSLQGILVHFLVSPFSQQTSTAQIINFAVRVGVA